MQALQVSYKARLLGSFFVERVFQAFAVHHGNFSVLHAIELMPVGLMGVADSGFIVGFIFRCGGGKVVFGRGGKVVRCHPVVVAYGLDLFFKKLFGGFRGTGFRR